MRERRASRRRPAVSRSRKRRSYRIGFALVAAALVATGCTGERPTLLEAEATTTSETTAPTTAMADTPERDDCVTANGPGPWTVTVEPAADQTVECVLLAAHHRVEFVNNTADEVTFGMAGISAAIDPASTFLTEPASTFLQPGLTMLDALPHPVPGLWLIDPAQNRLAGQSVGLTSIGDVDLGLGPAEITGAVGGMPVELSGDACYVTHIVGDPYSPLFTIDDGQLAVIQVFTPGQLTRSEVGIGATEGDVLAAYGDRIESQPSPDGNPDQKLLVFVPVDVADQQHRLVFVLENDMVVGVRTGLTDLVLASPDCPQ